MNKLTAISGLVILSVCLVGCKSKERGAPPPLTPAQQTAKDRLASLVAQSAQTAQSYKAMDNSALVGKLIEQSAAQREPFNSPAYRELRGRTDVDPNSLIAPIRERHNGSALLPLLLLRKQNQKAYLALPDELRASVLTDALHNSKFFNTWGLPHLYLEDASQAMLETGKSANPALKKMLSETRPAPLFGSQEYLEYQRYKYRLCDYALFFLEKLQGHADFKIAVSPAERDSSIKELLK